MIPYWRRVKYAFRTFFSILDYSRIPADVSADLVKTPASAPAAPPQPPPPPDPGDRAIQVLAILQRDGRLVDFLMEDLAGYDDAQVGAAVRDVQTACRQSIEKYLTLEPVMAEAEGQRVAVDRHADAARVKVIGNITGQPPYRGTLRHRGWDATRIDLPPLPAAGRSVLAPAEVEIE